MQERPLHQMVNLSDRQKLIWGLPCFAKFNSEECQFLASLFEEVSFNRGENIVEQESLVDSIYIIVEGIAEVTRTQINKSTLTKRKKISHIPLATLNPEESIGLTDTGFYSKTGKRTATVTALTNMLLLRLDLNQLKHFFQTFPHLKSEMIEATETLLRMRLIKQSLPFSRLSPDRLAWLIKNIEEIVIPKNTVVFQQGAMGDCCYLIRSGKIEIIAKESNLTEHTLAILKPPMLFGEATLMAHTPRNATARAVEECRLLVLPYRYLIELIESEKAVADMLMTLMVDRSRPIQNSQISVHSRIAADGQEIFILKNPANGNYFKLSQEGWFIWQQLDGKQTMQEITLGVAERFDWFAPDVVVGVISKLAKGGYIKNINVSNDTSQNKALWIRFMLGIRRILEARIAIGDANRWLTAAYNRFVYLFFTPWGKRLLLLLVLSGIVLFGFSTPYIFRLFESTPDTLFLIFLLIPFALLSAALHELGHAFATKSFGFEVHYMGIGWYWLGPVAFTDTSDMWLGTRWPRIVVNLAGIVTDLFIAGVSAILIYLLPNSYIQCFLWLFALYNYINAFRMLSPLQDLDGYYVLMDLFEKQRLRRSAILWLIKDFPKAIKNPKLFLEHRAEISYWVASLLFLTLVTVITLLIQLFVFKLLRIPTNLILSLCIPFLIILFSCLGIVADIRSQVRD